MNEACLAGTVQPGRQLCAAAVQDSTELLAAQQAMSAACAEAPDFHVCALLIGKPCTAVCQDSTSWAARCNTWLLIKLTPKRLRFSFLFPLSRQHLAGLSIQISIVGLHVGHLSGAMLIHCCSKSNVQVCVKTAPGGSEHPDQRSGP